ncbi:MAG: hypothetical protein JXB26_08995 [Candidatus Aminicenantes bacterium]|nr:hypothetical protein [Candidatus Aminicenantes bacterium]
MRNLSIIFFFIGLVFFNGCGSGKSDRENTHDVLPVDLLRPQDLEYAGVFRLPEGEAGSEVRSWAYGGWAMTYYPGGDSEGPEDGYPGSIYGTGHAWEHQVSEISIPAPAAVSERRELVFNRGGSFPVSATLQHFRDIFQVGTFEIPRTGMEYFPAQEGQSGGKLYLCWGAHFQEVSDLTHGWCGLNLADPQLRGAWFINTPHHEYNTNDYIFAVQKVWADTYTPGMRLGCGRFRDGGWSGQGPALFAYGPWNQGNPPPDGSVLEFITLLCYTSSEDYDVEQHTMEGYHHSDEWTGGAWLHRGNRAAVIFIGTKGLGDCWYGDANGPCLECQGDRGWWSSEFAGRFIFYDPADLARVALGEMETWEPQPFDWLDIDERLLGIRSVQQKHHLGACCFDEERGIFYVFEPFADGDKPVIQVWKIRDVS